jgi:hypothetical protein
MCYLYDIGCPRSMIPTHSTTCTLVPLWPFLMSIHGVALPMADGIMYFILYLVEVTPIMHIITVTLLHFIHLVMEVLLLPYPLTHLSHGHVWYIVRPIIQQPL